MGLKAEIAVQYEMVAGLEPANNGIGTMQSVSMHQRLVHNIGYLVDWTRTLLSLSGDASQLIRVGVR